MTMLKRLTLAALALAGSVGAASAVPIDGRSEIIASFNVTNDADGSGGVTLGDTVSFSQFGAGAGTDLGDFDAAGSFSSFSLFLSAVPSSNNSGTSLSFGSFAFDLSTTEAASTSAGGLTLFALGTVDDDGSTAVDYTAGPGSLRLAISSPALTGFATIFIASPPERLPDTAVIPLPAGAPLLLGGLGLLAFLRRRNAA
jgi:hypothetical protein